MQQTNAERLTSLKEKRGITQKEHDNLSAMIGTKEWVESRDGVKFDAITRDLESLDKDIERLSRALGTDSGFHVSIVTNRTPDTEAGLSKKFSLRKAILHAATPGQALEGVEKECYQEAEREARSAGIEFAPNANVRIPGFVAGRNPKRATAVLTATDSIKAGNVIATELMDLIPILEPDLVMDMLGITKFMDLQGNVDFPRQRVDAKAFWADGEDSETDPTDVSTDKVSLSPKRLTSIVELTERLTLQGSLNVENWIRQRMRFGIKKALEIAIIDGSGLSGQPTGISGTSGVNDITLGTNGAALTWENIVDFEKQVAIDNGNWDNIGWVLNPATFGKLKVTKKDAGSGLFLANGPIGPKAMVNDYKAAVTTLCPGNLSKGTGTDLSLAIFGNWSDVYLGQWGGVGLIVNPYSKARKAILEITMHSYWDVAVAQSASFAKCDEIVTV